MLVALLAALAPANTVPQITTAYVTQARDRWLVILLALGCVLAWPTAPWLTCIGLRFVWQWRDRDELESLVPWLGVAGSWYALRAIPDVLWGVIPYAWLLCAAYQVLRCIEQREAGIRRPHGTFGSAPNLANFLALVAPFTVVGWWMAPAALAVGMGLWMTSSILALGAVVIGGALLYPYLALLFASAGFLVVLADYKSRRSPGKRFHAQLDRLLPRTASNGTIRGRWLTMRCILRSLTWNGHGPRSMTPALIRWSAQLTRNGGPGVSISAGEACCDPLQLLYEYGVFGLAALIAFLCQIGPHLKMGDPWSAAFVVGCLLSIGHYPTRLPPVGLTFLAIAAGVMR